MSILGDKLLHIRAFVEDVILSKVRIEGDREHEILLNRMVFCAIFSLLLYFGNWHNNNETNEIVLNLKTIHLCYSLAGAALLAHLIVTKRISPWRRVIGIIVDVTVISSGMSLGGEFTAVGYTLFLWVVFGNGFRFGTNYLYFAAGLTLAGFSVAILRNPFWNEHVYLDIGLYCGLIMLPAYAARLIKKISDALQKAEEANRAKGLFIASVSHELRTPLTSIIGLGELLQSTSLTSEQDNMVRTISSAGRSLLRMINSILNIAKAEESQRTISTEKIDLFQLLSDIRAMLSVQAQSKETQLVFEINPSTPQYILGNLRHLEEILINLVGNAVKFTLRGSVRVLMEATPAQNGKFVLRCNIYDTGIGIAPDKQEKIFERFTQADETIIDQFGGSGLGLAITKQLVELYGGKIGVNSALGQGSHFWFEMDVMSVTAEQTVEPKEPSTQMIFPDGLIEQAPAQAYKILVAEDNLTNQKIITKILTLAGHNVTAVDDGEKALDALLGEQFDIALMDINMPVMNGLEATRLYHFSDTGHDHTPIIALTADASEQTRRRCLDAGIRAFCTKPIETDRLLAIISQVANTYSLMRPSTKTKAANKPVFNFDARKPAIDPEFLANLTRLGGVEFCNDIVSDFLNESDALANSIKDAVSKNDLAAFHDTCHALQSCSGNVGAVSTVDLLIKLQQIDAESLKKSGPKILKSLSAELDAVRNVLFNRVDDTQTQPAPLQAKAS